MKKLSTKSFKNKQMINYYNMHETVTQMYAERSINTFLKQENNSFDEASFEICRHTNISIEQYHLIQGTDRLCKVIKLSMQCCGQILKDSFETYKTFPRCINIDTEFECKDDVQNHEFG